MIILFHLIDMMSYLRKGMIYKHRLGISCWWVLEGVRGCQCEELGDIGLGYCCYTSSSAVVVDLKITLIIVYI